MKKEELLDIIGEAPDEYIKDAKEFKKKHRTASRPIKWVSAIAAMLAIVLLIHLIPNNNLVINAEAVALASEPRVKSYKEVTDDERDEWRAANELRRELLDAALPSVADFAELCSKEVISGSQSQNYVWSPVNAYIALAMTAELSDGEAQAELLSLLGVESITELRAGISAVWESVYNNDGKEKSVLANSVWIDDGLEYSKDKMDVLSYDYYASVYRSDLGSDVANQDITNWINKETGGLLSELIEEEEPNPYRMMSLVSTIYFQAKWYNEFNKSYNTEGVFRSPDGDVSCTFMNKTKADMAYFWSGNYSAVRMRLNNGSYMWFILPDEGKSVQDVLSGGDYMNMVTQNGEFLNYKGMLVNLSVPKFDVSASIDLKSALEKVGLTKMFDPSENAFSSSLQAKDGAPLFVSSVKQGARVMIDEEGVTAASYTKVDVDAGASPPSSEIIDFVLDRPFVFAITNDNVPLFVGAVNTP